MPVADKELVHHNFERLVESMQTQQESVEQLLVRRKAIVEEIALLNRAISANTSDAFVFQRWDQLNYSLKSLDRQTASQRMTH